MQAAVAATPVALHEIECQNCGAVLEVAQGVGRSISNRIARALVSAPPASRRSRPARRYAAQWAWVEQARPRIDELAAYRRGLPDPPQS